MSQNGILKCFFVDLKDFWKFKPESKFCQKFKILMTAVLIKISDFDHLFITFNYDVCEFKVSNSILKCSFVDLKDFWKFKPES